MALESRGKAQAVSFISWREAVLRNGPAPQYHPPSQLGGLGKMLNHGKRGEGKKDRLNDPAEMGQGFLSLSLGAHREFCWTTLHGDGQEVYRVAS